MRNTANRLSKYIENSSIQGSFYVKKENFHLFYINYLFHFLQSCFSLTELTSNFLVLEIMAFTILFVPLKEVSFPEDPFPLLSKFVDDEVIS